MPDSDSQVGGLTPHLVFAIIASAIGSGFQHGYHTGVVNAPEVLVKQFIKDAFYYQYDEKPSNSVITILYSCMVSIFCLGGMLGGLFTSFLSERFGRKGGLLMINVLVIVACALMGFSKMADNYHMLIAGRFIIGINSGLNAGLAPMYLTEISPVHLRGAVGTIYQLIIVISILISQIFGISQILGTQERWPILFAVSIIPAIFMLATLSFCPESPRYILIIKKEDAAAEQALAWFRQKDAKLEMDGLRVECEQQESMPKVTLREVVTNPALRKPLVIASVVMLSQQLSGINAIIFYSTGIFIAAGLKSEYALYATVGVGVVNLVMTLVSMMLVEKAGRKVLLLTGYCGMMVISLLITIALKLKNEVSWFAGASVALVIIFIMLFAVGPGPIPWFLVNEFFSQGSRPIASGIAVAVNWLGNFIVSLGFLPLQDVIHEYVFLIFTCFLVLFSIYIFLQVPETKGRKVEDIAKVWQ